MNDDRRRSNFLAAMLGALAIALPFGALALSGVFDARSEPAATTTTETETPPTASSSSDALPAARGLTDVSALYERASAGVVSVQTSGAGRAGTGSGFVLDEEGYILTNEHVVENAQTVQVRFTDGDPVKATVVGADASTDLALLKVDPADAELKPLALGSSKGLKVGQPAIAIGSPFGLEGTLTTGVISATGRTIQAPNNFSIDGVVQTDAAINPGNSGGPLLDGAGRVIGINAQIASSSGANNGVGFAIPIDIAKELLPALKSGKPIERPLLGVSTSDAPSEGGALVEQVLRGGPADRAGLRVGDRIVAIGPRKVTGAADVVSLVTAREPDEKVDVKIKRGAAEQTLGVTLGRRPSG